MGYKPKIKEFQYRGLVLAHCPTCGDVKVFSCKEESEGFVCKTCHTHHRFESGKARGVFAYCKCGNKIHAVTNCTEDYFEFSCRCGCPVPVEYNKSKMRYTGME